MTALYPDTSLKMEQMHIGLIRRMPSWKKFAIVDDLTETVKAFATCGIKQRHPDATPMQVQRFLADLMLGTELASKVYGDAR